MPTKDKTTNRLVVPSYIIIPLVRLHICGAPHVNSIKTRLTNESDGWDAVGKTVLGRLFGVSSWENLPDLCFMTSDGDSDYHL